MTRNLTWFITGASRGLGNVWTRAALRRGDRVVATARDVAALKPLADEFGDAVLPLTLDVTDRRAAFAAVARGVERYGGIDVAVNNAGYGLFGAVEEVTEAQARAQLETNLFGALWVTQAVLPGMRERGRGHILQVSSLGGVAAFPMLGLYHASKWGLEAFSESLAQEAASSGIRVTIIEPGPYGTDWGGASAVHAEPLPAYDQVREARRAAAASREPIDPEVTADAVLAVVDAERPPPRVFLGGYCLPIVERAYADRLAGWREWQALSESAG
ncbi:SDR family NAD(P)-dependent oxidoreductase [Nonomuraea aridisoli]|uniref:Short-chain dehydrogenase/reductase n=1 Tax=Nonomuraea aridisoli TaxID=2070368 RepID=A0A2W2EI17_9ACTN|nr:SDR family NAD(P)-dependent oxidoreductase [Nonomuraea aridisoli]PZG16445.1 short-chain dehydrogenase/reductase [Nonomuraea aridisoli]